MCTLLSSLILPFFSLPLREIVQAFTDAVWDTVIKSGNHEHKAAHANIFLMIEQNNTLKYKWVEYCDWHLNHPKHYRQYSILLFVHWLINGAVTPWLCSSGMSSLLLYVPFYSILSFLPFAKAHWFHYNIAYGHGGPPNLTPEAGEWVQRGAERGCAPATSGWNRLEGTFGKSSLTVKQNQL